MIELSGDQIRKYAAPLIYECMGSDVGSRFDEAWETHEGNNTTDLFGLFYGEELTVVSGLGAKVSPEKIWLGYLAVHPAYRRHGLGTRALHFVEKLAIERGYKWMFVETYGSPIFEAAIKFYEDNGYKQVGELPEYLDDGSDALYFRKCLRG
jgi:GNAT superfamily N-acetyltransferase